MAFPRSVSLWGNAMGPRALWTFLRGMWLLAGMENCGFGSEEVELAVLRRRLLFVGLLGPGFKSWWLLWA